MLIPTYKLFLYQYRENKKRIYKLKEEVEIINENLYKLKGVVFHNENRTTAINKYDPRIKWIDKKTKLEKELSLLLYQVEEVEKLLNVLPEKEKKIIVDIFLNKKTYSVLSGNLYYSERQLKRKVNNILSEYIKKF